jgi:hypothetical protein
MIDEPFEGVAVLAETFRCTMPVAPTLLQGLGSVLGYGGGAMAHLDDRERVVEEWLRLPESRRRHATDAVAFAYRLLREQPELFRNRVTSHEHIVNWLSPYLNKVS